MFGLIIALGGIWAFVFILLAPDWLFLLAFAPLGAYGIHLTDHTYWPWLIPILVFDIETLEGDITLRGVWKYIAWLPTVFFLALIGYLFNWHNLHFSFLAIWKLIISVLLIIVIYVTNGGIHFNSQYKGEGRVSLTLAITQKSPAYV